MVYRGAKNWYVMEKSETLKVMSMRIYSWPWEQILGDTGGPFDIELKINHEQLDTSSGWEG